MVHGGGINKISENGDDAGINRRAMPRRRAAALRHARNLRIMAAIENNGASAWRQRGTGGGVAAAAANNQATLWRAARHKRHIGVRGRRRHEQAAAEIKWRRVAADDKQTIFTALKIGMDSGTAACISGGGASGGGEKRQNGGGNARRRRRRAAASASAGSGMAAQATTDITAAQRQNMAAWRHLARNENQSKMA
jgi:hypothetical protein